MRHKGTTKGQMNSTPKSQVTDEGIALKELLRQIQKELVDSENERKKHGFEPLFKVHSLDIQAHFVLKKTTKGKGLFDLKLITIGGERTLAKEMVHTISLHLELSTDFGFGDGTFPREMRT